MLADPFRRFVGGTKGSWSATGTQSEGALDNPLAASVAVAFIGKFYQNCDQLAIVQQNQGIVIGAVGSDAYLVG